MNLMKTLSLAAFLAALSALPTASADVDVVVNDGSFVCFLENPVPPATDPVVAVDHCQATVRGGPGPSSGCPEVPPRPLFASPTLWVDSHCTVHVRVL